MDPLHVVMCVPFARESFSRQRAVAFFKPAQNLLVIVHSMGFPFMSEQTGSRRERVLRAATLLASVGFEMRVQVFAGVRKQ